MKKRADPSPNHYHPHGSGSPKQRSDPPGVSGAEARAKTLRLSRHSEFQPMADYDPNSKLKHHKRRGPFVKILVLAVVLIGLASSQLFYDMRVIDINLETFTRKLGLTPPSWLVKDNKATKTVPDQGEAIKEETVNAKERMQEEVEGKKNLKGSGGKKNQQEKKKDKSSNNLRGNSNDSPVTSMKDAMKVQEEMKEQETAMTASDAVAANVPKMTDNQWKGLTNEERLAYRDLPSDAAKAEWRQQKFSAGGAAEEATPDETPAAAATEPPVEATPPPEENPVVATEAPMEEKKETPKFTSAQWNALSLTEKMEYQALPSDEEKAVWRQKKFDGAITEVVTSDATAEGTTAETDTQPPVATEPPVTTSTEEVAADVGNAEPVTGTTIEVIPITTTEEEEKTAETPDSGTPAETTEDTSEVAEEKDAETLEASEGDTTTEDAAAETDESATTTETDGEAALEGDAADTTTTEEETSQKEEEDTDTDAGGADGDVADADTETKTEETDGDGTTTTATTSSKDASVAPATPTIPPFTNEQWEGLSDEEKSWYDSLVTNKQKNEWREIKIAELEGREEGAESSAAAQADTEEGEEGDAEATPGGEEVPQFTDSQWTAFTKKEKKEYEALVTEEEKTAWRANRLGIELSQGDAPEGDAPEDDAAAEEDKEAKPTTEVPPFTDATWAELTKKEKKEYEDLKTDEEKVAWRAKKFGIELADTDEAEPEEPGHTEEEDTEEESVETETAGTGEEVDVPKFTKAEFLALTKKEKQDYEAMTDEEKTAWRAVKLGIELSSGASDTGEEAAAPEEEADMESTEKVTTESVENEVPRFTKAQFEALTKKEKAKYESLSEEEKTLWRAAKLGIELSSESATADEAANSIEGPGDEAIESEASEAGESEVPRFTKAQFDALTKKEKNEYEGLASDEEKAAWRAKKLGIEATPEVDATEEPEVKEEKKKGDTPSSSSKDGAPSAPKEIKSEQWEALSKKKQDKYLSLTTDAEKAEFREKNLGAAEPTVKETKTTTKGTAPEAQVKETKATPKGSTAEEEILPAPKKIKPEQWGSLSKKQQKKYLSLTTDAEKAAWRDENLAVAESAKKGSKATPAKPDDQPFSVPKEIKPEQWASLTKKQQTKYMSLDTKKEKAAWRDENLKDDDSGKKKKGLLPKVFGGKDKKKGQS